MLCILFGLAQLVLLPFWLPCTVLIRDLLISAFRSFASAEGVILPARWWGKVKTTLTFPAAAGLVIKLPGTYPLLVVATFVSVASGLLYLYDNRQLLAKAWKGSAV
jgi:CDP-diacylglycerol--glycerol-3-phosphate 3-phosphatidyltransferase